MINNFYYSIVVKEVHTFHLLLQEVCFGILFPKPTVEVPSKYLFEKRRKKNC
jgi:hypothetical protein